MKIAFIGLGNMGAPDPRWERFKARHEARVELATVERALGPEGGVGVVEVDEFAAVGEGAAVVSDGHLITILKAALADATEIERRAERKGDHG